MKKRDNNYKIKEKQNLICSCYPKLLIERLKVIIKKCYKLAVQKAVLYKEKEDTLYYLSILCFKLAMIIQFLFDDLKQLLTSQSLSIISYKNLRNNISQRIKKVPSPEIYDSPGNIGDPRNYLPSQYSTRSGFQFCYQERQTQEIKNTQFPETYSLTQEFGDFEYPPSF